MPTDNEINDLATTFAAKVQARYRPATPDEAPHALDDFDAIVRANDLPFDYEKSDLYDEAVILACVMLEPAEGVMPRWVPRTGNFICNRRAQPDAATNRGGIEMYSVQGFRPCLTGSRRASSPTCAASVASHSTPRPRTMPSPPTAVPAGLRGKDTFVV